MSCMEVKIYGVCLAILLIINYLMEKMDLEQASNYRPFVLG